MSYIDHVLCMFCFGVTLSLSCKSKAKFEVKNSNGKFAWRWVLCFILSFSTNNYSKGFLVWVNCLSFLVVTNGQTSQDMSVNISVMSLLQFDYSPRLASGVTRMTNTINHHMPSKSHASFCLFLTNTIKSLPGEQEKTFHFLKFMASRVLHRSESFKFLLKPKDRGIFL